MLKTKLRLLVPALLLAVTACASVGSAQTATSVTVADPLSSLPASDLVAYANVRKILTEAVPRLLARQPELLAQMTGLVNMVRAKTGINIMAVDRVALGARLVGPVGPGFKKESIGIAIIAHGDFDANALVEFAKRETKGKISEQSYSGKVVYSEPPPEPPRTRAERATVAFSVLDANTVVIGDLTQVRETLDAMAGKERVDAALVRHATQDANALFGVAVKFSPTLAENVSAGTVPDETGRAALKFLMATLKELFASLGSTPSAFNFVWGVRFCDADQAQAMSELLQSARRQAGREIPEPQIKGLLESIDISAQGSEVQVKAEVKDEVIQEFIKKAMEKPQPTPQTGPPPAVAPQTAPTKTTPAKKSSGRGRRRRG